ncbi:MAG: LysR family transcriptional regulator [Lachnospiraceae bacterium]|nr:LysR family transcriptional regulator [Lachnospiraceae bacterium]
MNTTQLECFISLSSTLNYMKSSEQLGLSQPAVTKQIKSLENELGARLFDRTTRSVSLTQIGRKFLPEATEMLNAYYRTKDWISGFHQTSLHSLRIGYSDPHCMNITSKILKELLPSFPSLHPSLIYDQTDANLSRLTSGQLDLILGMRDARFSDENIIFKKLHEDYFVCVVSKSHPILEKINFYESDAPAEKKPEVTSGLLWNYRQVINLPPYLMKNYFSRGHRIVPVNDELDNIICINTNEAYPLVISGFGYSLIPEHLLMPHPDLVFLKWKESPHSAFGIYYRKEAAKDKASALAHFVKTAKALYEQ